MKKILFATTVILGISLLSGCISSTQKGSPQIIREECTVEQFIALFDEYNKDSGRQMVLHTDVVVQDGTGRDYQVVDITPENVYDEVGCRIFKIIYDQTYIVFEGRLYPIGREFGGFGITDINTCDFDKDGQKDIIYTFSWGSGLHRSNIAVFSFTTMEEKLFEYANLNDEMMLEKMSDIEYQVYDAKIIERKNEVYQFTKGKLLFKVKSVNNYPEIEVDKRDVTTRPAPSIGIPEDQPPEIAITAGGVRVNCIVGSTRWNGSIQDRGDVFKTIVYGNEIPYFRRNEVFHIELMGSFPNSIELRDDILNDDGSLKYTQRETQITPINLKQNNGSYTLAPNLAALLSSDGDDYEPGAVIRGFRLVCTWGDNVCEYAFVIRSDAK